MSNIFEAAGAGNLARVKELLTQGGLDLAGFQSESRPDLRKLTALYRAARNGHMDVAEALIRAGAPLNVPDEDWSPLHGAVMDSHHDVAAMLLREGADVDAYSKQFGTPLCCAKDRPMAALLIAAGADVNAGPSGGPIPLRSAAMCGHLGVMEEILSHPDINVNKQGGTSHRTPLHWAAYYGHSRCVAALLAAGADACITDEDGITPLHCGFAYCEGYSAFRITAMLVAAGDRQWECVPSPCPGLESALLPVWREAPQELGQLFSHLEDPVKRRIQAALCTLHHASSHHLPEAIRMRLLNEAFN